MTRMAASIDPMTLVPQFPSQQQQIVYNTETEVNVPLRRAAAIKRIQLRRYLQWVGVVSGSVAGVVLAGVNVQSSDWLGVYIGAGLVGAAGLVYVWHRAEWDTDQLIIDSFRSSIVNPFQDSERQAMFDKALAWVERQQKQPAPGLQPILLHNGGQTETVERAPELEPTPAVHLLAFMRVAKDIGWSRRAWCTENGPRTTLATGVRVQRREWREYTEMAQRFGFAVANPDGSLEWAGDPATIIEKYRARLYEPWQPSDPCP